MFYLRRERGEGAGGGGGTVLYVMAFTAEIESGELSPTKWRLLLIDR